MKPIDTEFTNRRLGAPEDWDPTVNGLCAHLPVHATSLHVFSWWKLTWLERLAILFGKPIRLCVSTTSRTQPPVSLTVTAR